MKVIGEFFFVQWIAMKITFCKFPMEDLDRARLYCFFLYYNMANSLIFPLDFQIQLLLEQQLTVTGTVKIVSIAGFFNLAYLYQFNSKVNGGRTCRIPPDAPLALAAKACRVYSISLHLGRLHPNYISGLSEN